MQLAEKIRKVRQFVLREVWNLPPQQDEKWGILGRIVRIGHLVVKGFNEDDLTIHASSLTFVSLTSLVPLLAVAFAMLKGFGVGTEQINTLAHAEWLLEMPEAMQAFVEQVLNIVNNTNFSTLGFVGLIVAIFTAIMLLANIEKSFNRIWGVSKNRSLPRQITSYTSVLVLLPLLIFTAISLRAQLAINASIPGVDINISVANSIIRQTVSFLLVWAAFACLYVMVPNVSVRLKPALISSLLFTLLFLGWQKIYMVLQFGVARYNAIYGVFAAVPVTFAWLYAAWVIILLGAEFTFAMQNSETYQLEGAAENASIRSRLLIALLVMRSAGQSMLEGKAFFDSSVFARDNRVPIRLVNSVLAVLVKCGFLTQVGDQRTGYVLIKAPEIVHLGDIVNAIMSSGAKPDVADVLTLDENIKEVLGRLERCFKTEYGSLTLRDLAQGGMAVDKCL